MPAKQAREPASVRNCRRMSRTRGQLPCAGQFPWSRSVTDTSMMFMIPDTDRE